jgi:hypothetical protein
VVSWGVDLQPGKVCPCVDGIMVVVMAKHIWTWDRIWEPSIPHSYLLENPTAASFVDHSQLSVLGRAHRARGQHWAIISFFSSGSGPASPNRSPKAVLVEVAGSAREISTALSNLLDPQRGLAMRW